MTYLPIIGITALLVSGITALLVSGITALIFFRFSVKRWPFRPCPVCRGRGRDQPAHFGHCSRCADTGRILRRGGRISTRPEDDPAQSGPLRRLVEDVGVNAASSLAGWLAGSKRADYRLAWAADLCGDPQRGGLSSRERLRHAAGFVIAAARMRTRGARDSAWRPADTLLASWHGSRLAMCLPVTVVLGLVLSHEGFYGLVGNADNLGVIAVFPYAAIKALRKYRQIDAPNRPERKSSSANGPKQ
jgi:hypothetical protein